jgi:type IX secretion system PorP/SprF family membrane protein
MRRILLVLIALGGLFVKQGFAQDPQFSQFYAAPLYINPAFTGASEFTRFGINYRNQWPSLNPSANFVTFSFYADHYLPNINSGVGLIVTTDREGTEGLQSTNIALSYAYQLKVSDNLVFRPGFNVGYTTRNAQFNNLIFASQIDPVTGAIGGPTDPAIGANNNLNSNFLDIAVGGILYSRNLYLGIAAHHINEPDQSILELSATPSNLPMRISVHGGYKIKIGEGPLRKDLTYSRAERSLTPVFQYRSQGPFEIIDVGAYLHLEPINLGVWYRGLPLKKFTSSATGGNVPAVFPQNEALIFSIGVTTSDFNIGYSFDYTLSELGIASGGAHEFSISYYLNFKKPQRVPRDKWKIPCPKN